MLRKRAHIFLLGLLLSVSSTANAQLNTDRITAIGRNALYFEDYVLAIQYFNQVIQIKPYLSEPYLYRAIAKIQLEDYQGALTDCDQAVLLSPFQHRAYYTRGYVHRQLGNYPSAISDFSQALLFSPDNSTYLLLRADTYTQQQHPDSALLDLQTLLRRSPRSSTYLVEQGHVKMLLGDTLGALSSMQAATDYDSQNPTNWSALGVTWLVRDSLDQAQEALSRAIQLGSRWAGDFINRGLIYYRRYNYRGAQEDYDKAVLLAPNDAQVYYNRAMLRYDLGDYNRALDDMDQAITLCPEKTEMRYHRALCHMRLRMWKQAIDDLETLIQRYPYFLPAYSLAAEAHTSLGHTRDAYRLRQQAYELEQRKDQLPPAPDVQAAASKQRQPRRQSDNSLLPGASPARGQVQYNDVDASPLQNVLLTYYSQDQSLRRTNYSLVLIDLLNRNQQVPAPLRLTSQDIALSEDLVGLHFHEISTLTDRIEHILNTEQDIDQLAMCYLVRALEFALVQDYASAIADCTHSLQNGLDEQLHPLVYFCRANWRSRLLQSRAATTANDKGTSIQSIVSDWDLDILLRDYDQAIRLLPDFSHAYYNKANVLYQQGEWQAAIDHYTRAIDIDSHYAEAYFNRGLSYLRLGNMEAGRADLSRAGELGIYQAYNLISRLH